MPSTLLTNIGQLVTNEPAPGRTHGPLGIVADAAVLVESGRVAWVGAASDASAGASAESSAGASTGSATDTAVDVVIDLGGRALIPGFVDSHSHIVFGRDRVDEFEARMSGAPYSAGGIRSTVAATRASKTTELTARARDFVAEMRAQGTTTVEVKSGYGLTVNDERRILEAAGAVTEETTFLGAHVVPPEFANDAEGYVDLVVGEMLDACAPHARWIDVFCETGAFTPAQSRRILEAGAARGLGLRVHASQLGTGPGVRLAVELGAASVDHCTYLTDDDIAALAASGAGGRPGTVATLLPGVEFSTRHPYPDARRLIDAGVTVALASDCNPGSSFTSSMPFCIALAVRELRLTPAEALWAATAGGAAALRRTDIGRIVVGGRADLAELAAPSYVHLAYRPGVPLVRRVWKNGVQSPSTPSPEAEAEVETTAR